MNHDDIKPDAYLPSSMRSPTPSPTTSTDKDLRMPAALPLMSLEEEKFLFHFAVGQAIQSWAKVEKQLQRIASR